MHVEYDKEKWVWNTECGQVQFFSLGNVDDNDYTYCPFCGKKIVESEEE
jgi:hypothetical protein